MKNIKSFWGKLNPFLQFALLIILLFCLCLMVLILFGYVFTLGISTPHRPDNEVFHRGTWTFSHQLGINLPKEIKKNIQCYGDNNWMGDGEIECSFITTPTEIQRMLDTKPNGNGWKLGPFRDCEQPNECGMLNEYTGANADIKIIDGKNIYYSFKSRSPDPEEPYANYDLYIIDTHTNTVMIIESDS